MESALDSFVSENSVSDPDPSPQGPPTDLNALLTTEMLAKAFHMSARTLEGWRVTGQGPPFMRAGPHKILYRWGSSLGWLNSRECNSTSEELSA
jgi:hypothetical protein